MYSEQQLEPGLARLESITKTLNLIAKTRGITKDNKTIWGNLHRWTNEDWAEMLVICELVIRQTPEYTTDFQRQKIHRAVEILQSFWEEHPRILDTKEYKITAWAALMSMREIYNQCVNEQIVDSQSLIAKKHRELFQ